MDGLTIFPFGETFVYQGDPTTKRPAMNAMICSLADGGGSPMAMTMRAAASPNENGKQLSWPKQERAKETGVLEKSKHLNTRDEGHVWPLRPKRGSCIKPGFFIPGAFCS